MHPPFRNVACETDDEVFDGCRVDGHQHKLRLVQASPSTHPAIDIARVGAPRLLFKKRLNFRKRSSGSEVTSEPGKRCEFRLENQRSQLAWTSEQQESHFFHRPGWLPEVQILQLTTGMVVRTHQSDPSGCTATNFRCHWLFESKHLRRNLSLNTRNARGERPARTFTSLLVTDTYIASFFTNYQQTNIPASVAADSSPLPQLWLRVDQLRRAFGRHCINSRACGRRQTIASSLPRLQTTRSEAIGPPH